MYVARLYSVIDPLFLFLATCFASDKLKPLLSPLLHLLHKNLASIFFVVQLQATFAQKQNTWHHSFLFSCLYFLFLFCWKFCDVAKVVIIPRKRVKFCYIPDMKVKLHINCSILLAIYWNLLWKSGKFGPLLPWNIIGVWFKIIFFRLKIGKTLSVKRSLQVHIAFDL